MKTCPRRLALAFLLPGTLAVAASCTPVQPGPPKPRQPNIIFIMADDLGYGHLGSYGQTLIQTPNLDRMAEQGTRFTHYYAGSSLDAPSRSVLLTGKHSGHTSVRADTGTAALLARDTTVGELMKRFGYRTGVIGKWGLGGMRSSGLPWVHGFDEFFGMLHLVHAHYQYPFFVWQGSQKVFLPENEGGNRGRYVSDALTEAALSFIMRHRDRPFFLYLPYPVPHPELLAPPDAMRQYFGQWPEPNPYKGGHYHPQPHPRTALAAMVSRLDRDVGRILAALRDFGLDEKTLVLFTSDNGASGQGGSDLAFFKGNGPLGGTMGTLREGGIRVPMIVRWPGRVPAGRTSDFVWAAWDVVPTLLEAAGVPRPDGWDGESCLTAIQGLPQKARDFLYWEAGDGEALEQAVRMGEWKAIRPKPKAQVELYNVIEDPGETKNLAGESAGLVSRITGYMSKARTKPRKHPAEEPLHEYGPTETGFVR
jgi:arylsulfatase A-like enzyme